MWGTILLSVRLWDPNLQKQNERSCKTPPHRNTFSHFIPALDINVEIYQLINVVTSTWFLYKPLVLCFKNIHNIISHKKWWLVAANLIFVQAKSHVWRMFSSLTRLGLRWDKGRVLLWSCCSCAWSLPSFAPTHTEKTQGTGHIHEFRQSLYERWTMRTRETQKGLNGHHLWICSLVHDLQEKGLVLVPNLVLSVS